MPAPLVAGAIQGGVGLISGILGLSGRSNAKREQQLWLNRQRAFQTPQEIFDALNATEQRASMGLPDNVLANLESQNQAALSSSIAAIQSIGADPNLGANIFGQFQRGGQQIAAVDTETQMKNFTAFLSALNTVAANKAAEQKSQQEIINNRIAAATSNLAEANKMIGQGISGVIGGASTYLTGTLYNDAIRRGVGGTVPTGIPTRTLPATSLPNMNLNVNYDPDINELGQPVFSIP